MRVYWLTALVFTMFSCSTPSANSPTPATSAEDVVTPVAGVYTLTKVTTTGGTPVVTGVGSLTIVAVDKTTANITQVRSFTNTATGATASISSVKNEANKLSKSGSDYMIKSTNGNQWATISGNKLTTSDYISPTATTSLTLTTEYTK